MSNPDMRTLDARLLSAAAVEHAYPLLFATVSGAHLAELIEAKAAREHGPVPLGEGGEGATLPAPDRVGADIAALHTRLEEPGLCPEAGEPRCAWWGR